MPEVYIEKRKRGVMGWATLLLFLGWNLWMLVAFASSMNSASEAINSAASEAEKAGATIGTGLGAMMILAVWCFGAVILGLLALLFRGSKTVVIQKS